MVGHGNEITQGSSRDGRGRRCGAAVRRAPASAANPPYADCPSWALCLYQHGGGTGSKAIITPTPGMITLYSVRFLNGDPANNQVSSWLNNSTCQVKFVDDPYNHSDLDFTPSHQYGATGDWAANSPTTG
ncbi:peptidase inhibitor family I36 protein [Streptomyces zhihengii]